MSKKSPKVHPLTLLPPAFVKTREVRATVIKPKALITLLFLKRHRPHTHILCYEIIFMMRAHKA